MPDRIPYLPQGRSSAADPEARERAAFYTTRRWQAHRKAYLAKHPLCARCLAAGLIRASRVVHHVLERLARPDLAWEWSNFEALCNPCHTTHHKRTSIDRPIGECPPQAPPPKVRGPFPGSR